MRRSVSCSVHAGPGDQRPHPVRGELLDWLAPRKRRDHYRLYRQLLATLPPTHPFWNAFAAERVALDQRKQKWVRWLYFGAVQHLILSDSSEPLAQFFPASTTFVKSRDASKAGKLFLDFICRRSQDISALVRSREVQINKLGRLALFAPMFLETAKRFKQPLAFVEIGSSVGLGLLWPHFSYAYPGHGRITTENSEDELRCQVRGVPNLPLQGRLPHPAFLCGIDPAPLSASAQDDIRWLTALTGPNDARGRARLALGLQKLARAKPRIEAGCVLDVLPRLDAQMPRGTPILLYHAMTMHHLREDRKEERFHTLLETIGRKRILVEAAVEWAATAPKEHTGPTPVHLKLTEWRRGRPNCRLLAETDPSADGAFLKFL